ncbi:TetR/AcrR family transcriptional regulator [Dyadobacter psychrotolerans]|uniref:TetR/AcrR family transcriptional regulator n=1 Tax=Dyadobacter psychrotolerans TaxID=2541721 RepID=A0A4R5DQI6_9BACT|nr:TetR/AcrR family transcriptional regulator [Dyadobacter psychrotolerans]TDE16642.1 TetR/AcrR family transcriptional regulator [Dyadobacter psychrotolerans]
MENKTSKADKTKQFIVEKTAPIFNKKGYSGTSLSDMIHATGLTKGSIYGNFVNKDDVALAAFDFNLQKVNTVIRQEMLSCVSYREKLLVYTKVYENFLEFPFPEGGCPVMNTAVEADDTHPQLRKKASDAIVSWKDSLSKLIKKGIAGNEFRQDVDPEQVSLTIIATIEGAIMITKLTGKLSYRRAIMKSVEKMINDLV